MNTSFPLSSYRYWKFSHKCWKDFTPTPCSPYRVLAISLRNIYSGCFCKWFWLTPTRLFHLVQQHVGFVMTLTQLSSNEMTPIQPGYSGYNWAAYPIHKHINNTTFNNSNIKENTSTKNHNWNLLKICLTVC